MDINTKTNINIKFLNKYPWAKKMHEQDWSNSKIYIDPDNTTVKKRQKMFDPNVPDIIPMELDYNSLSNY